MRILFARRAPRTATRRRKDKKRRAGNCDAPNLTDAWVPDVLPNRWACSKGYGATASAAGQSGSNRKKKLDVDSVEAETVRLIFKLYLDGDGTTGPLGVKETTKWLNSHGYRTRRGATFGVGPVHKDGRTCARNCRFPSSVSKTFTTVLATSSGSAESIQARSVHSAQCPGRQY